MANVILGSRYKKEMSGMNEEIVNISDSDINGRALCKNDYFLSWGEMASHKCISTFLINKKWYIRVREESELPRLKPSADNRHDY